MKPIFITFICFFACFVSLNAENWHPVHVLSAASGLPTDGIRQVYQDKDGYIWLATIDGLCRYDGYQLKVYKTNLYTPGLLSSNKINVVAEDGNHQLWIGASNGLNVLDKITGEIRQIDPKKLGNNNIQAILTTRSGEVWIGTANGLHKYVPEDDTFIYYDNANTNYRLPGNDIKTLTEDSKGNIWIGTWSEGIIRLDASKNIFYPYPRINEGNSAHVIFEDNKNNMWVGSWGYGLFRLEEAGNPQKVKYINYRHNRNNAGSLSDDIVYALSQDRNTNAIWVGTRSGLSILNEVNNASSFTNHLPNQSEQSLVYNELNSIICDNSGLMWLGTLGGGVSIVNTQETMFRLNPLTEVLNVLSSNSVRTIYVDKNGTQWLGIGSYGLVTYNLNRGNYTFFENHPDFTGHSIQSTVNSIIQLSTTHAYCIATYGQGIFIYNPEVSKDKVVNITVNSYPWLTNDCVYSLKEDVNHTVWIGTLDGISTFNLSTHKGASYPLLGQKPNGVKNYPVLCIEEENEKTVWLATEQGGVFKVNKNPLTSEIIDFERYSVANGKLNNDDVQYIYKDSRGRIWAGSEGGGLSLYDKKQDVFVSKQQEYNIPGDIVYNIVEDDNGDLWMGTNAGLVVLKFPKEASKSSTVICRIYTIADGLQNNSFHRNAVFKTADGVLYFGGQKGYNRFYPPELYERNRVFPVVITDIKIFNKSLESFDEKLRHKISGNAPGYTAKIVLPYNYNNFSIEFAALNYSNSMQTKYAYRLAGFEKEWQQTDAKRRFAFYNNLPGGTYFFHLQSPDENGVWNETGTPLEVVVLPPPWFAWWAFLIYAVLIAAAVYYGMKIAKGKLLLKNTIRVKDLEKQKTEELNHAKLQFFTNITHEFLTPLTILSASVDELQQIAPQNKDFYDVMSSNINRLIRLLQQILEFRKAETGNLKLKVSKGDMAAFVKSGVDSFKPLMKKNKMHFSLLCDPESIPAYFDHDKLDKIVFNLLSNAAKYNKPGGFIQVNVSHDSGNESIVIISVRDNGEGIRPQEVKNLFKRFYEGDYRRFNTIGTGIGLSLTKDLVNLHRGEISVESTVGIGTTFFVKIPIQPEAYTADEIDDYTYIPKTTVPVADTEEEEKQEKNENLKDHSLLLVEDNEELLQLMVKLLSKEYNIFTAKNGKEGIQILEAEYIDLTISDIMMPEMDGIEFCKYVKNNFEMSHVPVILLTAKNKEEDRAESYDAGADGFITKPFNMQVLHSKIKNLLKAKARAAQEFKKQLVFEAKDMNYTSIDKEFLNHAIDCVHEHIKDTDFDQQQFADALGSSKSTLYKKLKSLTGLNTSAFIRNIRLKTACKIIEENKKIRVSELAYAVGFNDPKYFSACFKKEFGLIPSEYLDKIMEDDKAGENP